MLNHAGKLTVIIFFIQLLNFIVWVIVASDPSFGEYPINCLVSSKSQRIPGLFDIKFKVANETFLVRMAANTPFKKSSSLSHISCPHRPIAI